MKHKDKQLSKKARLSENEKGRFPIEIVRKMRQCPNFYGLILVGWF